ncbi:MAG: FkbM family methyltransferase [Paracoccaceae bacterium]|nr:FkbM family methyltransferase [Paracoccaceae bacterium]
MNEPTDKQTRDEWSSSSVATRHDETLFEHPPLLESSRTKWQYGEWRDLANIPLESLEDHPDRAKIALLVGAAKAHLGEIPAARVLLRQAREWGCRRELIARVLTSAIHNSLGRIAVCLDDDEGASSHFEAALTLVEPRADAPLLARTRRVRETARMGLLPDAANLIGEDLAAMEDAPIDHASRLASMRVEFNLLNREIAHMAPQTTSVKGEDVHHPVFESFERLSSEATGFHVYDFLGGATRVAYNRNWGAFATLANKTARPKLPPKNEHYLDWIAVLTAAAKARGVFRMAEFGAGWAPWLVRGALAARQRGDVTSCELMAVEADPTHYSWILEHFEDNGLNPDKHHILHGAVTDRAEMLRFPVVAEPNADYSTSLEDAKTTDQTIDVQGHTVAELLDQFSGPLDFLHVDIQGAEYDALAPAIARLSRSVRAIMIGTHDDEIHEGLVALFRGNSWHEQLNLGRSKTTQTPWGEIKTDDGFLWFENAKIL